jgi:hypothetical protein
MGRGVNAVGGCFWACSVYGMGDAMTDTKQPEALRLADELDCASREDAPVHTAADELRRLHEVNAELLDALKEICNCPQLVDEATVPKAGIETSPQQVIVIMFVGLVRLRKALETISKAEVMQ